MTEFADPKLIEHWDGVIEHGTPQKGTCNIIECSNKKAAKGFCDKHHHRYKKWDNPTYVEVVIDGKKYHPLYYTYRNMKSRCYNSSLKSYPYYGGRSILVCERWQELNGKGFDNFVEDMGNKPSDRHSLDRINNDGDYESSNCRWATYQQQCLNQRVRKDNESRIKNISRDKTTLKWIGRIRRDKIMNHIGVFKTIEEAINAKEEWLRGRTY